MASWVGGVLDFSVNPANTNITNLIGPAPYCGMLGPYVRSPSYFDALRSINGALAAGLRLPRVRSYSMNNFVGEGAKACGSTSTSFQLYETLASIGRPNPNQLWIIWTSILLRSMTALSVRTPITARRPWWTCLQHITALPVILFLLMVTPTRTAGPTNE